MDLNQFWDKICSKKFESKNRVGKSKNRKLNSKFDRNDQVTQQIIQKASNNLQPKILINFNKLLNEVHIDELSNCSD